jgi:AcrR family transcriptional regulator
MPRKRPTLNKPAEVPGNRTKDPQRRRQNIIDAALKLFAQKGVSATSIRDIVQLSGESLSTVYYYFDDKEDLFITVMTESALQAIQPVLEAEKDARGDAVTRLRRLLSAYTTFMTKNPESSMMVIRGLLRILEHENTPFVQVMADRFQAIQELVKEGYRKGELEKVPEDLFAFCFVGLVIVYFFANLVAGSVDGWPFRPFGEKEFVGFVDRFLLSVMRKRQ